MNQEGMALPLELRRHNKILDAWDMIPHDGGLSPAKKKAAQEALAYRMYRNEAGEQVADTGSRAIGENIKSYDFKANPHEMFDQRRTADMVRNFGLFRP